jgi:5-formyltetrahydrofolate cyclo-ligase
MRDLVLGEDMQVRLLEPVPGMLGRYQELVSVIAGDVVSVGMVDTEQLSVDMLVVGSMGVDSNGYRVGKEGDLTGIDYILGEVWKSECLVVTLVHDCQVFEQIPADILTQHDLPVDIIVTPTRVIRVQKKVDKPIDISWGMLKHDFVKKGPLDAG